MKNKFIISTNGEVLCKCPTDAEGSIAIPEGIVAIRQDAFRGCEKITNVAFPATIKKIGSNAFYGCVSLKRIQLPNGIEYIGLSAFNRCHSMESAVLPSSLSKLPSSMFENCLRLKYVKMPESGLIVIDDKCFKKCISLTKIVIPCSVISIGRAFCDCWNLSKVIIKTTNVSVNKRAFEGCTGNLIINCVVTASGFFKNFNNNYRNNSQCRILRKKDFPAKAVWPYRLKLNHLPAWIEVIEEGVFRDWTGLEEVCIHQSVKIIGSQAFLGCNHLTQLVLEEGLEVIGENAFEKCQRLTALYLPNTLKRVSNFAFAGCTLLREVSISQHTQVARTAFGDNVKITYRQ